MNEKHESMANALNEQGFFLSKKIYHDLKNGRPGGWEATHYEYPFAYPPANGPIKGMDGRVDIIAKKSYSNGTGLGFIECKRADPKYCDWVFLPSDSKSQFFYHIQDKKSVSCGALRLSDKEHDISVFDTGIGIKNKSQDKKMSDIETIEKPCEQVCHSTVGLGINKFVREIDSQFLLIPIVITTANLFTAEYSIEKINLSSGKVEPSNLKLEPVNWLCFNYPLPQYLHFANEISHNFARKMSVWIVNSCKYEEFLKILQL